jgi:hypothetical protein
MDYVPWITPGVTPFHVHDFADFTYEQAVEFTDELVRRIPERREQLEILVRSTPGYSSWVADYSTASLEPLGAWAKDHLPIRPPTPDDKPTGSISPECPVPREMIHFPTPKYIVTDLGWSVLADIGIHVSELLRRSDPCWTWTTCRDAGKSYMATDHHAPSVSWRGRKKGGWFCPFFTGQNCVRRILDGSKPTSNLRSFLEHWISKAPDLRERFGSTPVSPPGTRKPRRRKS